MIGKLIDVAHKNDERFFYDPNNDPSHVALNNKIRGKEWNIER